MGTPTQVSHIFWKQPIYVTRGIRRLCYADNSTAYLCWIGKSESLKDSCTKSCILRKIVARMEHSHRPFPQKLLKIGGSEITLLLLQR